LFLFYFYLSFLMFLLLTSVIDCSSVGCLLCFFKFISLVFSGFHIYVCLKNFLFFFYVLCFLGFSYFFLTNLGNHFLVFHSARVFLCFIIFILSYGEFISLLYLTCPFAFFAAYSRFLCDFCFVLLGYLF
jgi:hypothetical protein